MLVAAKVRSHPTVSRGAVPQRSQAIRSFNSHKVRTTNQSRLYSAAAAATLPVVSPKDVYKRLKTGERAIFIDVRSEEMYNCFRVYNAVSTPAATFSPAEIADMPKDGVVYIYGEGPSTHPDVQKVATAVKSHGVSEVFTVNGGIENFKDAGFFYWMDVDAENARKLREEEAKKAAAAAKK